MRSYGQQNYTLLIQNTFHNSVVNYVLSKNDIITLRTLPGHITAGIIEVIKSVLRQSEGQPGIVIDGAMITDRECPAEYRPLFNVFMQLKQSHPTPQALLIIAGKIQQLDSYKKINPTEFLIGALGLEANFNSPRGALANSFEALPEFPADVITPEDIRERFYNAMAEQGMNALEKGHLTLAQFNEQDPIIFSALTELTLLEAIQQSQQCSGIQLLHGKIVNLNNVPNSENFPDLVKSLLAAKERIRLFSDIELLLAKKSICECESESDLAAIQKLDPSFKQSLGILKQMSLVISESRVFQSLFMEVMNACGANIYVENNSPDKSNATQRFQP